MSAETEFVNAFIAGVQALPQRWALPSLLGLHACVAGCCWRWLPAGPQRRWALALNLGYSTAWLMLAL